jgi:hypothetical protein
MVALVAAALVGQSLRVWESTPLGYSPRGILVASVDTVGAQLETRDRERIYRTLLAEVRSESRGAALAGDALPASVRATLDLAPDVSAGHWTTVDFNTVSDGYFTLLHIRVIAGRELLPEDDGKSRPVVVLNQAAAGLFWPGQNAIGRRLRVRGEPADREVVGVVADVRFRPLGEAEPVLPFAFLPIFQRVPPVITIHALTPVEPKSFIPVLRRIVGRTVKDMPVTALRTLEEQVQSGLSQVHLISRAIGAVSGVGVALAFCGILAAGAYRVAQRKREIAVRIAIGAEPRRVIGAFVARGLAVGLAGAAAGVLPAAWTSELLRSSLRGIVAPSPWLFGASGAALALAAGAAAWASARRIARVQPAEVLRMQ